MKFRIQDVVLVALMAIASLDAVAAPRTDVECMTQALYHEARGEPVEGIRAVKEVILNRVADRRWPNDICGVVFQKWQFSFANGGVPIVKEKDVWMKLKVIAKDPSRASLGGATHYFAHNIVTPNWASKLKLIKRVNNHTFYKE